MKFQIGDHYTTSYPVRFPAGAVFTVPTCLWIASHGSTAIVAELRFHRKVDRLCEQNGNATYRVITHESLLSKQDMLDIQRGQLAGVDEFTSSLPTVWS